jgi:Ca2+-binding EF-hand superfamily protein
MPAVSLPGAPNPVGRLTALLPRAVDDVMEACKVAKECLIAVPTVQQAFKIFKQYATTPDEGGSVVAGGRLTRAQFASLLSKALGFGHEEDAEGDKELTECAFKYAKDTIGFQDFAMWYDQHSFTEGLNVPSGERRQRRFAKELNMSTSEMDTYRKTFDIVDDDGSGVLEFPEFEEMLHSLFKVPKHIRISTNRISQLWKDCDADGNGVIDFEEFVVFYRKYFAKGGFDAYYQQAK